MSDNKLESLAADFVQAYNDKDFDRLRKLITPTFYFQHHNRDFEFNDPDEFVAMLKHFATEMLPERGFGTPTRVISAGNTVVIQHPWGGTPSVDIPGMGNAGERFTLDLCTVMVFDGELVCEYHDYG